MAAAVLIPVEEYLRTCYEPDADFVDGQIEERHLGQLDHSDIQKRLLKLLDTLENEAYFRVHPELRVKVSARRYRVPDVCLRRAGSPREQILVTPPLLCIEVLSPEDTMSRTLVRVHDFLAMGVPAVWVFDPETRTVQVCVGDTMREHTGGTLTVPETPVTIDIASVFRVLDEG